MLAQVLKRFAGVLGQYDELFYLAMNVRPADVFAGYTYRINLR